MRPARIQIPNGDVYKIPDTDYDADRIQDSEIQNRIKVRIHRGETNDPSRCQQPMHTNNNASHRDAAPCSTDRWLRP